MNKQWGRDLNGVFGASSVHVWIMLKIFLIILKSYRYIVPDFDARDFLSELSTDQWNINLLFSQWRILYVRHFSNQNIELSNGS